MRADSPSRTAIGVAMHRAVHQTLDWPPVFVDPFATRIIGERGRLFMAAHPRRFERSWYAPYLRAALAARSRFAEESLAAAVARGVRQYVVLGAGLDTFAFRNTDATLRIFEVDHPLTQRWKRRLLADERLGVPPNLVFVPVDFERQHLDQQLRAAGFDGAAPAFFSWLGVVPYLDTATISATLATIAGLAGAAGGVVFDFIKRPARREWISRAALWWRSRHVARLGEPFRSYLEPGAVGAGLRDAGFRSVEILDPATINARYFGDRSDRLGVSALNYLARGTGRNVTPGRASDRKRAGQLKPLATG